MTKKPSDTNLPSQKELEKELSDYLSRKYGERVKIVSAGLFPQPAQEEKPPEEPEAAPAQPPGFRFDLRPEELIAYLDEYVVQQDEAKAILATKICTHFNRIRYGLDYPDRKQRDVGRIKNNVLMIGPTGVGKTFLIKLIAQRLGVPFIKGDATKFSETGYVGGDVEDLVRDLVREADGDIERAQYGIIYLDEIDKIASSQYRYGADVSRTGVQRALLKPMEETEVELKVSHDPISQLEAIEQYRATGKRERKTVNTRNILFIMSGAFTGLEEIIRRRVRQHSIGFESAIGSKKAPSRLLARVKAEDLIEFGFESEFVGRLPVIAVLGELSEEDLYTILLNPNSAVAVAKKQDFLAYGVHILFEDEACRRIAARAAAEQTGARGLVSVMERILLPFEKRLPSTDIDRLVVTVALVDNPAAELERLLGQPARRAFHRRRYEELAAVERDRLAEFIRRNHAGFLEEFEVLPTPARLELIARHCQEHNMDPRDVCEIFIDRVWDIRQCAERMTERCGIKVAFDEEAVDHILAREPRSRETIQALCGRLAEAFEYGLRLLSQKKGINEVVVPAAGIDAPQQFINDLVSNSFRLD